jgi:hypothetical protein
MWKFAGECARAQMLVHKQLVAILMFCLRARVFFERLLIDCSHENSKLLVITALTHVPMVCTGMSGCMNPYMCVTL